MKQNIQQGASFAQWLVVMFVILLVALTFALLVAFAGRFQYESVTLAHTTTVDISQNLPESARNAVLHLSIFEPVDASPTNYHTAIYGSRSLNSPVGSGSIGGSTYTNYQEERLVAINADGFNMLFTRRDNGVVQTNTILFRYGKTTQTNTLGWKIIGNFK
jgi:hypothetical protein